MVKEISPTSIITYLNKYVIGQEKAKETIALAGYLHLLRFYYMNANPKVKTLKKHNILLLGPSGSGKTLLVRKMCEFLNLPFYELSSQEISLYGFIGNSLDAHIKEYIKNTIPGMIPAAHGIVFIDELDKLTCNTSRTNKSEDHNLQVQASILKIVEGTPMHIFSLGEKSVEFDSGNLLFIFAGNFSSIREERTRDTKFMGFHEPVLKPMTVHQYQEELIKVGVLPELCGRISHFAELESLSKLQLKQILNNAENNVLTDLLSLLSFSGYDLQLSEADKDEIVKTAFNSELGARALEASVYSFVRKLLLTTKLQYIE